MSRPDADKTEDLTPTQQKKAQDSASAAGRATPDATDIRDAIKSTEQNNEQPKNTGNPNRTGNHESTKQHQGPKEH